MAREDWDELSINQARADADALAGKIRALDAILQSTKDPAQAAMLKAQLVDLQTQWEVAVTRRDRLNESVPQPPKTNGDMEKLNRQVADLRRAVATDNPDEVHAIISECAATLTMLDNRVMGLEGRVTAIEQHIHPPIVVTVLRVLALTIALFAGTLFWIKETREILFGVVPWPGIATEGALILAVVAILLLANAQMEKTR